MLEDMTRYIIKHISWASYNHTQDISRLNLLLAKYGLRVNDHKDGPAVTTYYVNLQIDSKINTLLKMQNNFAIACQDNNTRVYQDGARLCIEKKGAGTEVVFGDLVDDDFLKTEPLTMCIGMDNNMRPVLYNLNDAPHMLIAGYTGGGKSVLMRSIIASLIVSTDDVDFIGIDPKKVEFSGFAPLPNFKYVTETSTAIMELRRLVDTMDIRYSQLDQARCKNIDEYNEKKGGMRHIVCAIEEFADLMMQGGSELEGYIVRLAQKARACGIHLIIATQSPRADVITGLIKNNIPTRIALATTNATESRIIIDQGGAEVLNGHGDMLFLAKGNRHPVRLQGCNIKEDEVMAVVYLSLKKNYPDICKRHGIR